MPRGNGHSSNWGGAGRGQGRRPAGEPTKARRAPSREVVAAEPKSQRALVEAFVEIIQSSQALARNAPRTPANNPFRLPDFPARAMPPQQHRMAMDDNMSWASNAWVAGGVLNSFVAEGLVFPGYAYLSELTQRPEYRLMSETIADDATRKWIKFEVTGDEDEMKDRQAEDAADPDGAEERRERRLEDSGKTDKVKALKDEMDRLQLRDHIYTICRDDGFYGRTHLFLNVAGADLDFGGTGSLELRTPIGDGRNALSKAKIEKGSLLNLKTIEPIWTYPTTYNAINPLREDWYNPQVWYVMGQEIHTSRIMPFVSRPVPDILKPAYAFGGLSLSQIAEPYVDIWLRTRQSVADIVHSFSVMVLKTDLSTLMQPGGADGLLMRVAAFNQLRDNQGTFVVSKENEDFANVSAPLSGLDHLQAQSQEHMSSVSRIPLVKLTGISPSGLNACLPGDVLILTDRGQVPIRDVILSDRVMTRNGLAPLIFSGITKHATELIEIRTASASLKCTANHPIWLPSINAFVPAENVRHGDLLLRTGERNAAPKMRRPWSGAGSGGGRTRTGITSLGIPSLSDLCIFIGESGKHIADLFQWVSISTILTMIRKIIRSPISMRCMENFMPHITTLNAVSVHGDLPGLNPFAVRNAECSLLSQSFRAERNFAAEPAYSLTDDQADRLRQDRIPSAFVLCATRLSARFAGMRSFVRASVQRRVKIAQDTFAPTISRIVKNTYHLNEALGAQSFEEPIVSVRKIPASEPVYDLTVAPDHLPEFFANGILTHNSSEGEIRVYYDTIAAYQNRFLRPNLTRIIGFMQLNLWGEIDPEITFEFETLYEMSQKEQSEKEKDDAERHQKYVDMGAISPEEVRKVIIDDPALPYTGLDPDDVPDLAEEEEGGLIPGAGEKGGHGGGEGGESDEGEGPAGADGEIPFFASDEFRESDHPRAPDGKFGSGGGSTGAKQKPRLTSAEKSYIASYSGDDFLRLNDAIRKGESGGQAAEKLDSAIAKNTLTPGTRLFRGISKDALRALIGGGDEIKVGQVLNDPAFLSTSSNPNVGTHLGGVQLDITVGENQSGLDMQGIGNNDIEKEVLLPRGTGLRILGIRAPKRVGDPIILRVATETQNGGQDGAILPFAEEPEKKTLFLRRPLKNAAEFLAWARGVGFKKTLPADDVHLTIAFSKTPVDWDAIPGAPETLNVPAGDGRSIKPLGDKGAVVLSFQSDDLQRRWRELRGVGASWDYPTFQPHVTITYDGEDMDLALIEPYTGRLEFGPEEGSEIKENWFEKARESLVGDHGSTKRMPADEE